MKVLLFPTKVAHCRIGQNVQGAPAQPGHSFNYSTLSALWELQNSKVHTNAESVDSPLVGYNRLAPFSFWDKDYLDPRGGSLVKKLLATVSGYGYPAEWERIELLTAPRFFGYVFNPVNFFLFYRLGFTQPQLCVAEVNNTFGEKHLYIGEPVAGNETRRVAKFVTPKDFHVSPFYDRTGDYTFYVKRSPTEIDIRVNLLREGKVAFTSSIIGSELDREYHPLKLLSWGFSLSWLTTPRIVWQAALLKFRKRLPVHTKPIPTSVMTIGKRKPTIIETISMRLVYRYLQRLRRGRIIFQLPSGSTLSFGNPAEEESGRIVVRDWSFFPRLLWGGDVAFGECFTEGLIESENLTEVLAVFAANTQYFDDRSIVWTKLRRFAERIAHRFRANTTAGSRQNIRAHYDLGNELFKRFLDGQLVYSCAVFERPEETLEEAQLNKLRMMVRKARLQPSHNVLEIGSGWGAFAIEAARSTGCRVTTITLSEEQLAYAQRRVREEGLEELVTVLLCDYREIQGSFDRIVSIEMLEAVGHEHLGQFFEICDRLLKPDGIVALQFITVPETMYENYRKSCDWIQKYIFPGGVCPSLTAVCNAAAGKSTLVVEHLENIGPNYARTLQEWRKRFRVCTSELDALGYDERFRRMWEYYFAYCEAGFASRTLGTLQLVLTRPKNAALGLCPGYSLSGALG